ncbi:hypothetical protein L226DRAFT_570427 [Lentinus tigrinus ALCF2SS1-7]|uniref:uncharacterized protein n=1 Tax=Lentinus tigrinus ALCF2SS1-7 TaxID=1328758 RepID=UPI001165DD8C|nr:hypothetical protein L226DRAFT_570427 [Lentinus tigrinus ALCF2SS1-7]
MGFICVSPLNARPPDGPTSPQPPTPETKSETPTLARGGHWMWNWRVGVMTRDGEEL